MIVANDAELDGLSAAGRAVRAAFDAMKEEARPGISTAELDRIGAAVLAKRGALSAPQLFYDFPGATCISVNEEAAHGIPGERVLASGDMVNIDVSASLDGFVADMGESFMVGEGGDEQNRLIAAVQRAVYSAADGMRAGSSLNDIGRTVSQVARGEGFSIVENLGSHGLGRTLHEAPSYVPIDNPKERRRLQAGLVMTLEPFFATGARWVNEEDDGWTLTVPHGTLVAQFEHTFVIRDGQPPLILTAAGA
ncbi:MAG: type I methionyl aminopeptidase [Pseudomonadaceae bacterium]|nr:type I methionyl aminopeptidase [Pseudomonadaceae bacterium]